MRFAWPFIIFFLFQKAKALGDCLLKTWIMIYFLCSSLSSWLVIHVCQILNWLSCLFLLLLLKHLFSQGSHVLWCGFADLIKLLGAVRLRSIPFLQHWHERGVSHCNLLIWLVLIKQHATSKWFFLSMFLGRPKSSIYKRVVIFAIALET